MENFDRVGMNKNALTYLCDNILKLVDLIIIVPEANDSDKRKSEYPKKAFEFISKNPKYQVAMDLH